MRAATLQEKRNYKVDVTPREDNKVSKLDSLVPKWRQRNFLTQDLADKLLSLVSVDVNKLSQLLRQALSLVFKQRAEGLFDKLQIVEGVEIDGLRHQIVNDVCPDRARRRQPVLEQKVRNDQVGGGLPILLEALCVDAETEVLDYLG